MRGRVAAAARRDFLAGITPAYAGKRILSLSVAVRPWDHPRVCGEECASAFRFKGRKGSPPRMRGRDIRGHSFAMVAGITPAYAGKSTRLSRIQHCAEGSPPRMRGRGFEYVKQYGEAGITPAYAGKRHPYCGPVGYRQDHPRVCGEEERTNRCACWTEGSPPRMRGRVILPELCAPVLGITPAYAGKS